MASMLSNSRGDHASHLHRAPQAVVITDAREAASQEISSRMLRYGLAMGFRMACFLGMIFVDGWLRWALLAFAVFLPYVAVLLANQVDQRTVASSVEAGAPEGTPQLTAGSHETIDGEVIEGVEVEDEAFDRLRRAA